MRKFSFSAAWEFHPPRAIQNQESGVQNTNTAFPSLCLQRTPWQTNKHTPAPPSPLLPKVIHPQCAQPSNAMELLSQPRPAEHWAHPLSSVGLSHAHPRQQMHSVPTCPSEPSPPSDHKERTSFLVPAGHMQTDMGQCQEKEPTCKEWHRKGLGLLKRCVNKERRIWIPTMSLPSHAGYQPPKLFVLVTT